MTSPPDLPTWLRDQVQQDIAMLRSALDGGAFSSTRGPRWLTRIFGVSDRWAERFREETEGRLFNRELLLATLEWHPHDSLGCTNCSMTIVASRSMRCCPTVVLMGGMYRDREGYRPDWGAELAKLMNSRVPST